MQAPVGPAELAAFRRDLCQRLKSAEHMLARKKAEPDKVDKTEDFWCGKVEGFRLALESLGR
jgi:hypothetical protein